MRKLAAILGIGAMIGCSGGDEEEISKPVATKTLETDDISNFSVENILVYSDCSMKDAYGRALRSKGRGYKKFSLRDRGSMWKGSYQGRDITVACADDLKNLNGSYDVVNLRGHTGDMKRLYGEIEDKLANHTILVMGGCNSTSFIGDFAKENVAIFAGTGTQDTSNNNYLLLQLPKAIETKNSWVAVDEYLSGRSSRFDSEFQSPADYEGRKVVLR